MIFKRKSELSKLKDEAVVKEHIKHLEDAEQKEKTSDVEEIAYVRAPFWKRCSIILFDLIICALLTVGIFWGIREATYNSGDMKKANSYLRKQQIRSGLYVRIPNKLNCVDIIKFLDVSDDPPKQDVIFVEMQLETYFTFVSKNLGPEKEKEVRDDFVKYKFDKKMVKKGEPIFIKDEDGLPTINIKGGIDYKDALNIFYKPYVQEIAIGHFIANVPHIYKIQKYMANMLFFMEIPVSLFLGFFICYYIIPLCFYRNKQTLGRLVFKTGLVDQKVLSVKFGRFTARFAIMFIVEVLLSIVTLGIPLIISFSLMAFSKNKQNFHDYMLGIDEVDVSSSKIYYSMEELIPPQSQFDLDNFESDIKRR